MIAGLLLAAGESSRMGTDKALLTYRGRTFLETLVATLREAGLERIAVVLGYHAEEIQRAVNLQQVQVAINPDYRLGQTSSLQEGLRALGTTDLEGVILCLVDHPAISVVTVRKLLKGFQHSQAPVIIPTFRGRRGHPVLIARPVFRELLDSKPDSGADTVVRKYRESTLFVEVEDPGVLVDVDDPETYRRLELSNDRSADYADFTD
jgi:molybdenum cofactor cytidylyltransferase